MRQDAHNDSDSDFALFLQPRASGLQQAPAYFEVNVFQDLLDAAVRSDQFDGSFRADALDGGAVVAAQQDAQVYELGWTTKQMRCGI